MKLYIHVDPEIQEESVRINVRAMSTRVEQIRKIVETDESANYVAVMKNDRSYILPIDQISHFIAEDGKSFAVSGKDKFVYRDTLKYFETHTANANFVRISRYCLANVEWMDYFEAGFSGNLILKFKNGWRESVSRKYVRNLKEKLS